MVSFSKVLCTSLEATCDEIGHTWCESCSEAVIRIFLDCFRYSLKLYSPLYFVAGLLTRRNLNYFIGKMIGEILQSSFFLSANGALHVASFCMFRKLLGKFYMLSVGILPGLTSSFGAILFERKSRRGLLALYMMNVALETVYNILVYRGCIRQIPYGEVGLFMLATSSIMYLHRKSQLPKGLLKQCVKILLNEKEPDEAGSTISLEPQMQWIYQSAKIFAAGYAMKIVQNLVFSLKRIISKPSLFFHAMVNADNAAFGAFLGSMPLLFRISEYLMYKIRGKKDEWNSFIAGGVSGLSMLFQRNHTIALYILSKVAEVMYFKGAAKGYLPYFKHGDILLYAACTAIAFHCTTLEPHNLKPAYWNFMMKLTNNRFNEIDRRALDKFGLQTSLKKPVYPESVLLRKR